MDLILEFNGFGDGVNLDWGCIGLMLVLECGYCCAQGAWLVRANYENRKLNVEKTLQPLKDFFEVLIYGSNIELRNRFLRIGFEHGTQKADVVKDLHRDGVGIDVGIKSEDVGINVGIKQGEILSHTEEHAAQAILQDNRITAKALSTILGVTLRQAERIMMSLKKKTNLRREGSRKNGRWTFGD